MSKKVLKTPLQITKKLNLRNQYKNICIDSNVSNDLELRVAFLKEGTSLHTLESAFDKMFCGSKKGKY